MSHTKSAPYNTLPKQSINDSSNLSKRMPENHKTLVLTVLRTSPKFLRLVHCFFSCGVPRSRAPGCQGRSPANYTFSVGSQQRRSLWEVHNLTQNSTYTQLKWSVQEQYLMSEHENYHGGAIHMNQHKVQPVQQVWICVSFRGYPKITGRKREIRK